jgi:hypothetical protein
MSSFAAPILRFARTLRRAWMRGGDFRVLVYLVVLLLLGGTVFYTKQRKLPRIPYYSALG